MASMVRHMTTRVKIKFIRSSRSYILYPVIVTLACCILSSCSDGMPVDRLYEDKNILRIAVPSDPRSLDPAIAYDVVTWPLVRTVFHGLIDYDDDLNLFPWQAESWTISDNGRV